VARQARLATAEDGIVRAQEEAAVLRAALAEAERAANGRAAGGGGA